MADTKLFPGGKEVVVVRKEDIVNCINNNIVDKEVALAIVRQCEVDASNFLRQGRWTGIPFMGKIRIPPVKALQSSEEQQQLIEDARTTVSKEQYVIFRKELAYDNERRLKAQRYYNYVLSMAVHKNKNLFKKLVRTKGEAYARIHFFLNHSIVAVNNELDYMLDAEDSNDR